MANVLAVTAKGEKAALIALDDGSKPLWTPDIEKARELLRIGQPIPSDWTLKDGDYGPQAFPPKPAKGQPQAAWRNTKEGALFEREGYELKEERSDRRTALMQAVAVSVDQGAVLRIADEFYAWLRKTSGPAQLNSPAKRSEGAVQPGNPTASPSAGPESTSAPQQRGGGNGPSARAATSASGTSASGSHAKRAAEAGEGAGSSNPETPPHRGADPLSVRTEASEGGPVPTADGSDGPGEPVPPSDHAHDWKPSPRPNMAAKGWVVCECGATERQVAIP